MNATQLIGRPYPLFAHYTVENLGALIRHRSISRCHYLLKQWFDFPINAQKCRVELVIQEISNSKITPRDANLFELISFSISHFDFIREIGCLEGFDINLEEMGNELGVDLTVPIIVFSGGRLQVDLAPRNRAHRAKYKLSVESMMPL